MKKIQWHVLTCQETLGMVNNDYIRCGRPAVAIVLHHKEQKAYPMCFADADHNIAHRGGVLLATSDKDFEEQWS